MNTVANSAQKRSVFFISDGTGITAETMGLSLLAHFDGVIFRQVRLPFIDTVEKAQEALAQIAAAEAEDGKRAILMLTLVNGVIKTMFEESSALCLDLFGVFTRPMAAELGVSPAGSIGMSRRTASNEYLDRMEAINYTLGHDDGITDSGLDEAQVILVGVSRCGKTPTSLYLAMHFGIKVANYPIIPEDLDRMELPGTLDQHRAKLFGLSIEPERLHLIRNERLPNSQYAAIDNCKKEIRLAEVLMKKEGIHWVDSTRRSVEEIAAMILQRLDLRSVLVNMSNSRK
ncbi:MAG TPA: pyruvate, water dikinase regulatory protein [Methylophilaceae bacterium]|nr:pyruvate, water dikinase regulatory protein [Methylophilaceae bacterium]